jgi:hypothetical protein
VRLSRPVLVLALPLALVLSGCRSDPPTPAVAVAEPLPSVDVPAELPPVGPAPTVTASPTPRATRAPKTPVSPVSPAGPSLRTADWAQVALPAGCADPKRGAAVYGDLDGDGRLEAALPAVCAGPDGTWGSVGVYSGTAARPRLLGDALPAGEHGRLQAVEVRDGHLVVSAFGWTSPDHAGDPDLAVTTRWRTSGDALRRTDRWVDPAEVLSADDDDVAGAVPGEPTD